MTVAIPSLTTHSTESRALVRHRLLNYFIFVLCSSLYLFPFMRLLIWGTDEGMLAYGAVRVAQGQVFARDFFEIVGPGTFYWLALFFKLFGVTFAAERLCLFVTSLSTYFLMYFLSRRICARYQVLPCIILAGIYFGALWPTISHHVDSNCLALLSVACLIIWQDRRSQYLLFGAGCLAGSTTIFHLPKGILLFIALALWLWIQQKRRTASISAPLFLGLGYLGVVGIVLIYFWSHHALWNLVDANSVFPLHHYAEVNTVPYAQGIIQYYWNGWTGPVGGAKWLVGMALVLIIPFLFIATLPAFLVFCGLRCRANPAKPEYLLYWLCGVAMWVAEYHRKDMVHLIFGSPLLIILGIYYLNEWRTKISYLALQTLSISAVCLAALNLSLALFAHSVTTRAGAIRVVKNDPVLTQLDNRVSSGEEIFVYPSNPMYYFLTQTRNPIRFSGLMYNYNSRADFENAIHTLDRRQVKYVVWDSEYMERSLKLFFPSAKPMNPDELIVEPYLESHYKVVWANGGTRIMERKSDEQAR
jgi:hypothetical protein